MTIDLKQPHWIYVGGEPRQLLAAFPAPTERLARFLVDDDTAHGGRVIVETMAGDFLCVYRDALREGLAPRALPRRVEPSRNPLRLTTPERGLWWCITVGSLLWAGAVSFAVQVWQ